MKVEQQPAYLLHTYPYSETSLLVEVFTKQHGRLTLIAKGARRRKPHTRGILLPFKLLLVSWSGKGQLPILTSVEQGAHTKEIAGKELASGFYLNELLMRLLHRHDSHEGLFSQYHLAMQQLTEGDSARPILRIFEKKLLHHIGFGAVLDHDSETGETISAERQYRYVLEKGPVGIDSVGSSSVVESEADASMPYSEQPNPYLLINGSTLLALHEEQFEGEQELDEAKRLTRMLIDRQLNGRALRSRRVAIEMNQYSIQENNQSENSQNENNQSESN